MKKSTKKLKNTNRILLTDEKAAKQDDCEIASKKIKVDNDGKQRASDKTSMKRCYVSLRKRKLSLEIDGNDDGGKMKDAVSRDSENNTCSRSSVSNVTFTNSFPKDKSNFNSNKKARVCLRKIKPSDAKEEMIEEDGSRENSNICSILDVFLTSPERSDKNVLVKKRNVLSLSLKKKFSSNASSAEEKSSSVSNSSSAGQSPSTDSSIDAEKKAEANKNVPPLVLKSPNTTASTNNANNSSSVGDAKTQPTDISNTRKDNIKRTNDSNTNNTKPPSKLKRCSVKVRRTNISHGQRTAQEKQTPVRNKRPAIFTSKKGTTIATHQSPPPTCKSPDIFSDVQSNDEKDIYAFQTQSSQSEREDVAADIIEKMKKEGKVKVVKAKMQPVKKAAKKTNKKSIRRGKVTKNASIAIAAVTDEETKKEKPEIKPNKIVASVTTPHVGYEDESDFPKENYQETNVSPTKNTHQTSSGFSVLAQNVLRKETAKKTPLKPSNSLNQNRIMSKDQLLQIAKKFVNDSNISHSTPNKPLPSDISAIRRSNISASAENSPWRVNSSSAPQLFYFSRASDNLPSYSSDVLPSSQPINTSENRNEPNKTSAMTSPSKLHDNSLNISAIKGISPIKSNNSSKLYTSNIENISPIRPFDENAKDNAIIIGANPRRGLADRSPLKPINVLNVVTLPNRVNVQRISEKPKLTNENMPKKLSKTSKLKSNESHNNSTFSNTIASDFFGFSDENDLDEANPKENLPKNKLPNKKRLQKTLIKLKRLLPPKPTRFNCETIRSIFNSPKKQPDIREMLSSTRNKSMAEPVAETSFVNDSSDDEASTIAENPYDTTIVDDDLHLFDDPADPQPSFNTSVKIRTYQRPKRKARKVRSFVLFKSDTESDEEASPVKNKRRKPDPNRKELSKFIDEFNSMCEEVDQYELVVEKKKTPTKPIVC